MSRYILLSGLKMALLIGLPHAFTRLWIKYHFNLSALDGDFFGVSGTTMFLAFLVGIVSGMWTWDKNEKKYLELKSASK